MKNMKTLLALATVVILGPLALTAAEAKNGFQPLFNGKDLAGWKLRHPDGHNSWSVLSTNRWLVCGHNAPPFWVWKL